MASRERLMAAISASASAMGRPERRRVARHIYEITLASRTIT
jgi:hypothetical protein